MNSADPTPRLLAAGASLTGTGILMCRTEPSWDGILIGLLCLGLWALGTLATRPGAVTRPTRTMRPVLLEAVVVERPRPPPLLLPAPRTSADDRAGSSPSRLPDRPTHRPRVIGRRRG
jgi:hypothetical protein